jgi:hypothetical protein
MGAFGWYDDGIELSLRTELYQKESSRLLGYFQENVS